MISARGLQRDEIRTVWQIDRSEVIDGVYRLEQGRLVVRPHYFEAHGWPPGEAEQYTPILEDIFDHGGWLHGMFDDGRLVAVAVLDGRFLPAGARLQLRFMHVDAAWRGHGFGRELFGLACREARARGARSLYVSATPSVRTVRFYFGLGCLLSAEPDPAMLAYEPEDIHLECALDTP